MAGDRVRVVDFDALARPSTEPISVKVKDQMVMLPGTIPAVALFDLLDLRRRLGDEALLTEQDLMRLGSDLFGGDEPWRALLVRNALNLGDVEVLLHAVLHEYGERV